MKFSALLTTLIAILCLANLSLAGGPDSGFYLGGGGHLNWITGSGSWDNFDFELDNAFPSEDSPDEVGFAWSDKMMIGIMPVIGYKLSPNVALQVGYGFNITKSSSQSSIITQGLGVYEQGVSIEWHQRNLEVLGFYYPDSDLEYFFFGGLDLANVETDITIFETAQSPDGTGQGIINGDYNLNTDEISAVGYIFGAGIEFTSDNNEQAAFVTMQYSRSLTDETFFGTEGFKIDVGGITLTAGVKWYLF